MIAWRVTKERHAPFDGTGAALLGARWNSRGREVIYAADSFAGAILEILAHATVPRVVPGPHHAVRIEIPDEEVEAFDEAAQPGWHLRGSPVALAAGDRWHDEARSVALSVPSVPARPVGRNVLINPTHPAAARIVVSDPFPVPWDDRLF